MDQVQPKMRSRPGLRFESFQPHHALPLNQAFLCGRFVSGTRRLFLAGLFALNVSGIRKPVPGAGIAIDTSRARLTDETEHRCLAGPLDWRIAQAGDADAAWQSTFDSSLH